MRGETPVAGTAPASAARSADQPGDGRHGGRHGWAGPALWVPGLLVAAGAAVATAHGLYEVAHAAGAPPPIAGLYPLITDGLALVAYAATARLAGPGRRYGWAVVVLAAGLSGLAQASYLAGSLPANPTASATSEAADAPAALRFGVGAWPAIAAAIVAHLLYLLATAHRSTGVGATTTAAAVDADESTGKAGDRQPGEDTRPGVQRPESDGRPAIQPDAGHHTVRPSNPAPTLPSGAHRPSAASAPASSPADGARRTARAPEPLPARSAASPARDRARAAAHRHEARHGALPTVSQLVALAEVSRGTAGDALKDLRAHPAALHVVHPEDEASHHR